MFAVSALRGMAVVMGVVNERKRPSAHRMQFQGAQQMAVPGNPHPHVQCGRLSIHNMHVIDADEMLHDVDAGGGHVIGFGMRLTHC